jgi:hypothetical protein
LTGIANIILFDSFTARKTSDNDGQRFWSSVERRSKCSGYAVQLHGAFDQAAHSVEQNIRSIRRFAPDWSSNGQAKPIVGSVLNRIDLSRAVLWV